MGDASLVALVLVVVLGLAFEFVNGFHDAANAIATVVATRVLNPLPAVLMAGAMNFLGAVSGTAVATTLGKGLIDANVVTEWTIVAGLLAAIAWDLATWFYGIPSSSSHALVFGVVGAGIATGGFAALIPSGLTKVGLGIVYSPLLGFLGAALILVLLFRLLYRHTPARVSGIFGRLQLLSSVYMAFSHGSNDGQKTMGIISLALFTYGALGSQFHVPLWVIVASATAMALGTATGGWRIIKTMGFGLTDLRPIDGFAAETAAGTVIEIATRLGMPISTTHAINGAILGVGAIRSGRRVRWQTVGKIVTAWVLTFPAVLVLGFTFVKIGSLLAIIR